MMSRFIALILFWTLLGFAGPDSTGTAIPDSVRKNLTRADTVAVVKHSYQHREQIVTGGVIMACLVGILVVMNNYNPR